MQEKRESRNVVTFGLAYLLSAFGYEFMVFVMTVHIYDLTGSAMNVGLFTALTFLPSMNVRPAIMVVTTVRTGNARIRKIRLDGRSMS